MEDIYNEVFDLETEESGKLLKDLGKKYAIAQQTFADFPEEDQQFLQNFSFICLLSYDVYIKKNDHRECDRSAATRERSFEQKRNR